MERTVPRVESPDCGICTAPAVERYILAPMELRRLATLVLCIAVLFNGNGVAWAQVVGAMSAGAKGHAHSGSPQAVGDHCEHAAQGSGHAGDEGMPSHGRHAPGTDCCDRIHCECGCVVPPAVTGPLVSLARSTLARWVPALSGTPPTQFVPQHLLRPPAP